MSAPRSRAWDGCLDALSQINTGKWPAVWPQQ
ncbi:hypothetical protein GGR62_002013 [Xanthomonas campestris]|nr:hypothetical protein [Xanthomonas sp. 3075]